jgi:hypothetical protein
MIFNVTLWISPHFVPLQIPQNIIYILFEILLKKTGAPVYKLSKQYRKRNANIQDL